MKAIKGSVHLNELALTELPKWLVDVHIEKDFYCSNNSLTSLEGAPQIVRGNFYCYNNNLTSLEGAPQSVGRDFLCSFNYLTSIEGAPKSVGGDFSCHENAKQFTREEVRAVCEVKGAIFV